MRRADAGNTARDDLAALGHEGVQQLQIFVIDVVDLLDAEPADFLAPEILLLLGSDGRRPLRSASRRAKASAFNQSYCPACALSLQLRRPTR